MRPHPARGGEGRRAGYAVFTALFSRALTPSRAAVVCAVSWLVPGEPRPSRLRPVTGGGTPHGVMV